MFHSRSTARGTAWWPNRKSPAYTQTPGLQTKARPTHKSKAYTQNQKSRRVMPRPTSAPRRCSSAPFAAAPCVGASHSESCYRATSLIRNTPLLGSYSRTIRRVIWWSQGEGAVYYKRGTPLRGRAKRLIRVTARTCACPSIQLNQLFYGHSLQKLPILRGNNKKRQGFKSHLSLPCSGVWTISNEGFCV